MSETNREKLVFSPERAREIIWEDDPDFEIVYDKITDNSRWSIFHEIVVKRTDGRFFKSSYSKGSTESQDKQPFDNDEPVFEEVFEVEKTIVVYE